MDGNYLLQKTESDCDPMEEVDKVFDHVAQYFGLLADPTRLKILHCLCGGERPVLEVVEAVGLTQANISRHLNLLYRAGVVDRRREGNMVFYRVVDPNFVDLCRTVCVTIASRADRLVVDKRHLFEFDSEGENGGALDDLTEA